jgi:Flp pilus assembly protein TadD
LHETGRPQEAIDALERYVQVDPSNVNALNALIELYRENKQFDDALRLGHRLVALDPEDDSYLYTLAFLYDQAGSKDQAIFLLRRVIEMNPDNAKALNHLGYAYAELGQHLDEAERLVKKALELQPNNGFYIDSLGWVYYKQGDYEAAVTELEKAAKLAGNDPEVSEHLADSYRMVGRTRDAIRVYRDCKARTEDREQAMRVLRKLLELEGRAKSDSSGS